jgi:IclR family pca regulon transcriptional regulator
MGIAEAQAQGDREYVMGLEKGLSIIEAFGLRKQSMTLAEAAQITGHSRASARRCLLTLCKLGYARLDGRQFSLEPRSLRLGFAYVSSNELVRIAQPVLEMLSERTGESSSIAVLDSQDAVFVARSTRRHDLSFGLAIGSRLPAFCSATGRVLLATLPSAQVEFLLRRVMRPALTPKTETRVPKLLAIVAQARKLGYALCDEEIELGLRSIAVPVMDAQGRTVAAMSLAPAVDTVSLDRIAEKFLPGLESARRSLTVLLR